MDVTVPVATTNAAEEIVAILRHHGKTVRVPEGVRAIEAVLLLDHTKHPPSQKEVLILCSTSKPSIKTYRKILSDMGELSSSTSVGNITDVLDRFRRETESDQTHTSLYCQPAWVEKHLHGLKNVQVSESTQSMQRRPALETHSFAAALGAHFSPPPPHRWQIAAAVQRDYHSP